MSTGIAECNKRGLCLGSGILILWECPGYLSVFMCSSLVSSFLWFRGASPTNNRFFIQLILLKLTPLLMGPGGSMPHSQGLSNNSYHINSFCPLGTALVLTSHNFHSFTLPFFLFLPVVPFTRNCHIYCVFSYIYSSD